MITSFVSEHISLVPFTIAASDGEMLSCDARFPADNPSLCPVIIVAHGFKGFKDWGSFPYTCTSLAQRGFYVVSFNFSHNGVEGSSQEFTRLDKFALNTYSREVRELYEVVDAVASGQTPESNLASLDRLSLLGHSRGGGIVLLEAARDSRIGAVVAWAPVSDVDRYSDHQKEQWREAGYFETKNMRTGQMMRLDISLLEDIERNADTLNIPHATATLQRPLLILHGEQDLSVRIDEGEYLAEQADRSLTEFERIPRTAHTFGAVHPFEGSTDALEFAINRTGSFLHVHLESARA